jgi:hypothetical protein
MEPRQMKILITLTLIAALALSQVGCASYAVYHHNKTQLTEQRQARGETPPSSIGEVVSSAPWLTVGAAIADIATGVVGYKAIAGGKDDEPKNTADNNTAGQDQVNVSGDNNNVVINKPVAIIPPVINNPPAPPAETP